MVQCHPCEGTRSFSSIHFALICRDDNKVFQSFSTHYNTPTPMEQCFKLWYIYIHGILLPMQVGYHSNHQSKADEKSVINRHTPKSPNIYNTHADSTVQ